MDIIRQCDKMFGGFITGKVVDSLIIGIICFICMNIMKLPYATLISLIVGITNVIPFFGPYIGAVPSAFLILLVDPIQCAIFVVFIIIEVSGSTIKATAIADGYRRLYYAG
ncbi:MAG: AI-2E family transporter [Lachnospiraceae bacterium]|nr:AI-2E family transporter [Lachnospiraceae bacterium]